MYDIVDKQCKTQVHWFVHHIGGVLESLIANYRELNERIQIYQTDRSERNLNSIMGGINFYKITLNQLKSLAQRDIPLVSK